MFRSHARLRRPLALVASLALVFGVTPMPAVADSHEIWISEIRIDQPSTDNDEYFELAGTAEASLDSLTYLVIGDGTAGSGVVEAAVHLDGASIGSSGFFVAAESTFTLGTADLVTSLNFENSDNVTHLLVDGFTGANGDDLDPDDDGALDSEPWTEIVDLVALIVEDNPPSGTEYHYGPPTVGPDGSFVPGHVYRCDDTWNIGAFDPSVGADTPGAANACGDEPDETVVLINELDADQVSTDAAEFVELYDGGAGNTDLDGMALVLFNGSNDTSYAAFDLDGQSTDADGFFVLCGDGANVANCDLDVSPETNLIQNGADAAALYAADGTDFPNGTAVTTTDLVDAIVYDTSDGDDAELMVLLNSGQPQVDENGGGDGTGHSNQRCPNGSGGARNTDTYEQHAPTPGIANVCPEPPAEPVEAFIHDVQGDGFASPMVGNPVIVEGIAVGDFQGPDALNGFFLQEEDADADADTSTSEGIFVFDGDFGVEVSERDRVRVTGTVTEFFGLTEITDVTEVTVTQANDPAAPVPLPAVTALSFPLDDAEREAVEGMLVSATEMYVTDTFDLHRFGQLWLGAGGVIEQPTNELPAGPDMEALAAENMLRSILLDDGSDLEDEELPAIPYLHDDTDTLRVGDSVDEITAVMSFGFGSYRLQPVGEVDFEATNPRPEVPDLGGDLKVASFNVLNYWTTIGCGDECRGAQTPEQLEVQTDKLVAAIMEMEADIVALQEIENPPATDASNPSDPAHTPITTLVDALNEAEGSEVWAWVGPADHYNAYPIRNEIIYRIGAVTPVGDPDALAHPAFDAIGTSGDPFARPPLAQTFEADAAEFTVVVNHLKSKGSPCNEPEENADGQGNCNLKRVEQAEALLDFVAQLQSIDPDVLVVGDMNAYMEEDPILTLETELTNLVTEYDPDPYSYNFFAMFAAPFIGRGSLDHALATPEMASQVTGTATWHINADEPRFLDWFDPTITAPGGYRSSDHDPVLIGLSPVIDCLGLTPTIVGTGGDDVLTGTNAPDVIAGLGGDDVIEGRGGDDVICGGSGDDTIDGGPGHDVINAGFGVDLVYGGPGDDTIHGGPGHDVLDGGAGVDSLAGEGGEDVVLAGNGDDSVEGGDDNDVLFGGNGDDQIDGGDGFDRIFGDQGSNTCTNGEVNLSCGPASPGGPARNE